MISCRQDKKTAAYVSVEDTTIAITEKLAIDISLGSLCY